MKALLLLTVAVMTTSWADVPLSMSTAIAADVLGVGVNTVREWLANGRLRGIRVGERRWIVPRAALIEFLGDDFLEVVRESPPPGSGPDDANPDNDRPDPREEEGDGTWAP